MSIRVRTTLLASTCHAMLFSPSNMDDSTIFPNFNLEIFSDFKTDDDVTDISDDITDEEMVRCVETIEKEQESVTNPPECRPQRKPENARLHC